MTKKIKVAFQGDKGAYSHIASLEAFPNIEPIAWEWLRTVLISSILDPLTPNKK